MAQHLAASSGHQVDLRQFEEADRMVFVEGARETLFPKGQPKNLSELYEGLSKIIGGQLAAPPQLI